MTALPYQNPQPYQTGFSYQGATAGPPGPGPTPQPQPTLPVGSVPTFTYLFTDLHGNRISELPLNNVTFSRTLNGVGQFTGTLLVEDPRVQQLNWVEATQENLTCVWVIINAGQGGGPGTVVYGGIVQQTVYTMSKQTYQITANEFYQYLNQRVQALDYSPSTPGFGTTWATTGAGGMEMAYQIVHDALAVTGSMPNLAVVKQGATPAPYFIVASFPLSQQQQIGSLLQQLQTMGYLVGFDFATDVAIISGIPTATITLSYPRRGRVAGTTGLVIDVDSSVDFTYSTDGTQQANQVWELATASGGVGAKATWADGILVDHYPLLEAVESHMVFSALTYYTDSEVSASATVLAAWAANDLMLYAYPPITPVVTMPLFGPGISIGDFIVGDDVRLIVPKQSGGLPVTCPRFPNGMDLYWRIIQMAVTVPDEGLPTMQLTLNLPPSSTPTDIHLIGG